MKQLKIHKTKLTPKYRRQIVKAICSVVFAVGFFIIAADTKEFDAILLFIKTLIGSPLCAAGIFGIAKIEKYEQIISEKHTLAGLQKGMRNEQ